MTKEAVLLIQECEWLKLRITRVSSLAAQCVHITRLAVQDHKSFDN